MIERVIGRRDQEYLSWSEELSRTVMHRRDVLANPPDRENRRQYRGHSPGREGRVDETLHAVAHPSAVKLSLWLTTDRSTSPG